MFCRILCCFIAKFLFYAIYAVLSRNLFCRDLRTFVWRKIEPKIASVEKKWQIWGMIIPHHCQDVSSREALLGRCKGGEPAALSHYSGCFVLFSDLDFSPKKIIFSGGSRLGWIKNKQSKVNSGRKPHHTSDCHRSKSLPPAGALLLFLKLKRTAAASFQSSAIC